MPPTVTFVATDSKGNKSSPLALNYTVSTPPSGRFFGDPGPGKMYWGSSVEGPTSATTAFEDASMGGLGLQPERVYEDSASASSILSDISEAHGAGRVPWLDLKFSSSWANVATGADDARLKALAQGCAGKTKPTVLSFHHEPYGDGQSAISFRAMYAHVTPYMKQFDGGKIVYTVCFNGEPFQSDYAGNAAYVPDPSTYDVFTFDLYNAWSPSNGKNWREFSDRASYVMPAIPPGKPWGVGEFGVREDPSNPQRAATWLQNMYDWCVGNGAVMVSYFNSGQNSPDGAWTLDGARLTKWKTLLNDPRTFRV